MALRGHWMVPHVSICHKHNTSLLPLWREGNRIRRYDSAPQLALLAPKVLAGEMEVGSRKALPFELWVESRLNGHTNPKNWLDQHAFHAAANFCRYLGAARLRLENIPLARVKPKHRPALCEMGFHVARRGVAAIQETLEELQSQPGTPQDGGKAIYPLMYERLAYDHRNDPAYAPFQKILRDHMAATWAR